MDMIGGNLAQQILVRMRSISDKTSVDEWSETTLTTFKQALAYDSLYDVSKVRDRMSELARKATSDAIAAEVNKAKDKDFSMRALADSIVRRLEQEDRAVEMIDAGHTAIRLETLRTRVEDTLDELQRKLAANINNLPTL